MTTGTAISRIRRRVINQSSSPAMIGTTTATGLDQSASTYATIAPTISAPRTPGRAARSASR
jgi:hypothetical protein